ncbi:hypothetical protein Y032_0046g1363 [Ancylostoma ceylanicum]|uniref:Uncharacterized protein n=1 Tax=Ancylostoma ceylanicum TaxID=53326 RepID=A0A016UDL3_9BILA|nr:hypothetical protein Y032_0046g1363 [Ancylostoma ceylanicum]
MGRKTYPKVSIRIYDTYISMRKHMCQMMFIVMVEVILEVFKRLKKILCIILPKSLLGCNPRITGTARCGVVM